jgi:hypothetical protein
MMLGESMAKRKTFPKSELNRSATETAPMDLQNAPTWLRCRSDGIKSGSSVALHSATRCGEKDHGRRRYRYIAVNADTVVDKGGSGSNVLVIVGHAGPDTLSGEKTWKGFVQQVTANVDPDWRTNKKTVYLVACSTAGKGTKFVYGNIAREIKEQFPNATVWASSTAVSATDLTGDWTKV